MRSAASSTAFEHCSNRSEATAPMVMIHARACEPMMAAVLDNGPVWLRNRLTAGSVSVYRRNLLAVRGQSHGGYDGESDV